MNMHPNLAIVAPLLTGDTMQTITLPATLPPIIVKRWSQAIRVDNRADWRQMAELCGHMALDLFCAKEYDYNNADFKAMCALARKAHNNGVACLSRRRSDYGAHA